MSKISLSKIVGSIQFVDKETGCASTHSPKDRAGCQVMAETALDERGDLNKGYEKIKDEAGNVTGYALRADAPIFAEAEETLKGGIRSATDALKAITIKIGGGAMVLPEAQRFKWAEATERIAAIVMETNQAIDAMRVDEKDPSSPAINELLVAQRKKPIKMGFKPFLHAPLKLADPNAEAQAREFVRSTWDHVKEIIDAVKTADPEVIGNTIREVGAIQTAILDPLAQGAIGAVIDAAKAAKKTWEIEKKNAKAIERANKRAESSERDPAAVKRDEAQIAKWTAEQKQAQAARDAHLAALAKAADDVDGAFGRFNLVEVDIAADAGTGGAGPTADLPEIAAVLPAPVPRQVEIEAPEASAEDRIASAIADIQRARHDRERQVEIA